MSVMETDGKIEHDFVTQELRAISDRLDALENHGNPLVEPAALADATRRRHDRRRHEELMAALQPLILSELNLVQQRLTRLESKEAAHQ